MRFVPLGRMCPTLETLRVFPANQAPTPAWQASSPVFNAQRAMLLPVLETACVSHAPQAPTRAPPMIRALRAQQAITLLARLPSVLFALQAPSQIDPMPLSARSAQSGRMLLKLQVKPAKIAIWDGTA